jgi:putative N-acetylmannosamine-6-phosphate epimerase
MSMKELQEDLVKKMKQWQKIEDASVTSTGKIIEQTDNKLIRAVAEIIQADSKMHYRIQDLIAATLEREQINLTPDDMASVWTAIEEHIKIEKKMVEYVSQTLEELKGKKMLVQEYLLNYLKTDEEKHDKLLADLEKIKGGMYPYAG